MVILQVYSWYFRCTMWQTVTMVKEAHEVKHKHTHLFMFDLPNEDFGFIQTIGDLCEKIHLEIRFFTRKISKNRVFKQNLRFWLQTIDDIPEHLLLNFGSEILNGSIRTAVNTKDLVSSFDNLVHRVLGHVTRLPVACTRAKKMVKSVLWQF